MVRFLQAVSPVRPIGRGARVGGTPLRVRHPAEEELLDQIVDEVAFHAVVQERPPTESTELGHGRTEHLGRSCGAPEDRERPEEILRFVVEAFQDRLEHVSFRLHRPGVEPARGEHLQRERVASGRGDDLTRFPWSEGGPAGCEECRRGPIVEAMEPDLEDPSPREVGPFEERRLGAARDEDLRVRGTFDEGAQDRVGGRAGVEVVEDEGEPREVLA